MPIKKSSASTATTSATTAVRPRRRTSALLSASTNGSEGSVNAAPPTTAAPATAALAKKSGIRTRTSISSTSLSSQQAAVVACSSSNLSSSGIKAHANVGSSNNISNADAVAQNPRASVVAAADAAAAAVAATAAPTKARGVPSSASSSVQTSHASRSPPPQQPTAHDGPPSAPPQAEVTCHPRVPHLSRSNGSGAAAAAPFAGPAAAVVAVVNGNARATQATPSTASPHVVATHADVQSARQNGAAAAVAPAASAAPPAPRRPLSSSSSFHSTSGTRLASRSSATAAPPAQETTAAAAAAPVAAAHSDQAPGPGARKRATAPDALGASSSSVTNASLKTTSSTSAPGKKKVLRRAGAAAPPSRRPSVSGTAATDLTGPPARDPSVMAPGHGGAAASQEVETAPSTALNTARTDVAAPAAAPASEAGPSATLATPAPAARRSRGPVVSEEWARSIIKPGDEQLLYRAATGSATGPGFARTPSGLGIAGGSSTARQPSKGRASPYETQLRRAQQTVLQRRHTETPTPGRFSAKAASVGAGSAASVASGGSGSRFGSTLKRSGTRMQLRRQEADGRQESLAAATATPTGEDGGTRTSNPGTAVGSASPTPSRMSEASTNTTMGGPGAHPVLTRPPGCAASAGIAGQRRSPSLTLFAKPSPRNLSTPSPRGSVGALGLKTTFGVSGGAYYAGNEELSRLTRVREEMLRTLMQSVGGQAAAGVGGVAQASSAAPPPVSEVAVAALSPRVPDGVAANVMESSASSLLTMHTDPQVGDMALVSPTSPAATRRPRQRVYGIELRGNDEPAPPQPSAAAAAAAGTAQPRGRRLVSGGSAGGTTATATSILASSIRQKPQRGVVGATVSPARPAPLGDGESGGSGGGSGATPGNATARPTLDTNAAALVAPSVAGAATPARLPRRPAVAVALSSLRAASTVADRVHMELVRLEQQELTATSAAALPARSGQVRVAAAGASRSAAAPMDVATRRLLLDPLFPLISEENYQRLVLQNDEYTARKELLVYLSTTPPPLQQQQQHPLAASQRERSPSPVQPTAVSAKPRTPGANAPRAARALAMDLEEANDPAPVRPLAEAALASAARAALGSAHLSPSPSPSVSPASAAVVAGTPPRRPSVQYGGPALHATFSPSRAPSPTAAASTPGSPGPRDGKLLVNAVMPTDKTGPIKPLAPGGVWYAPPPPPELPAPAAVPHGLSTAVLAATGVAGTSPVRMRSSSPTASCSSSRNPTRRGSLLRIPQHLQPHTAPTTAATTADASTSTCSDSADGASTASDEAVDVAESELCKALPRWGPFRIANVADSHPPTAVQSQQHSVKAGAVGGAARGTGTAAAALRKAKKAAQEEVEVKGVSVASVSGPTTRPLSATSSLTSAMAEELHAFVHVFLKRYRSADTATLEELGPVPETPLDFQRAIRRSLRLSVSRGVSTAGGEDAAELLDPLDDGSYHSQNVQYVLDLLGSLLQLETSFCEDDAPAPSPPPPPPSAVAADVRLPKRHRVSGAELTGTVMGRAAPPPGEGAAAAEEALPPTSRRIGRRAGGARALVPLQDPELRAVELMLAHDGATGLSDAESP